MPTKFAWPLLAVTIVICFLLSRMEERHVQSKKRSQQETKPESTAQISTVPNER